MEAGSALFRWIRLFSSPVPFVLTFCRRKSENRLQNEQINAFLLILSTKNEKSSTKRATHGFHVMLHEHPSPKHRQLQLFHILFHANPKTGDKKLKSGLISTFCTTKIEKTVTKSETTKNDGLNHSPSPVPFVILITPSYNSACNSLSGLRRLWRCLS